MPQTQPAAPTPVKRAKPGEYPDLPSSAAIDGSKQPALKQMCRERRVLQRGNVGDLKRRLKDFKDLNEPRLVHGWFEPDTDDDGEMATTRDNAIAHIVENLREDVNVPDAETAYNVVLRWLNENADAVDDFDNKYAHEWQEDVDEHGGPGKINIGPLRRKALSVWGRKVVVAEVPVARALEEEAAEVLFSLGWTLEASARLVEVFNHPDMRAALARLCQGNGNSTNQVSDGGPRAELEDGNVWTTIILPKFLDKDMEYSVSPLNVDADGEPHIDVVSFLDHWNVEVTGPMLKGKWSSMKSQFCRIHRNWEASGNSEPESFLNFTQNRLMIYMFNVLYYNSCLMAFAARHIDGGFESSDGAPPDPSVRPNQGAAGRDKRGKDDAERDNFLEKAGLVLGGGSQQPENEELAKAEVDLTKAQTAKETATAMAAKHEMLRKWMDPAFDAVLTAEQKATRAELATSAFEELRAQF